MQVVILAAGKGTRMGSLTSDTPKPMLIVSGRTLLEHKFDQLPEIVSEIILIIGHHGEVIRQAFGDSYKGKHIRYVEQIDLNGTMAAVTLAQKYIEGKFLVMMGDDLYSNEDILKILDVEDWGMLVERTESMAMGGMVITSGDDRVLAIQEGDYRGKAGLMNTNMMLLDKRIFNYPMVPKAAGSTEFGLPQTVVEAADRDSIPLHAVYATGWIQVTSPEDIPLAEARLKDIEEEGKKR